jgi:hypothetical protein
LLSPPFIRRDVLKTFLETFVFIPQKLETSIIFEYFLSKDDL